MIHPCGGFLSPCPANKPTEVYQGENVEQTAARNARSVALRSFPYRCSHESGGSLRQEEELGRGFKVGPGLLKEEVQNVPTLDNE